MKTSIATVSLSGSLGEKLEAIAAAKFEAVEIFENDLLSFNGTPADVRNACRRARPRHRHPAAVPRLRGHAGRPARARLRPRRAQVRRDAGARLRSPDGLQQRVAGLRSAASTAPPPTCASSASAPPSAACASPSRRWPGAATSTTTAMPGRRCAAPTIRRSGWCSTASTSWRARPTSRPSAPSRATASSWCRSPTRRCWRWTTCRGAGISATFPGQGDLPLLDFMEALQATGFDGAAVARDLQRPVPRRLGAQRRGRRPSLAAVPARPAARPHRQRAPDVPACRRARSAEGIEFIEFAVDDQRRAAARDSCCAASASAAPASTVEGGDALVAGRHQPRGQHARRKASPIPSTSRTARRSARSASRSTTPRRRSSAPTLLLDQPFRQAVGPGELEIPAVRGVGGSLRLFPRHDQRARPGLGHRVRADRRDGAERAPA